MQRLAEAEKIDLVYRLSSLATFETLIAAGLVCALFWEAGNHADLVTWVATLTAVIGIRLALFYRYFRINPQGEERLAWGWRQDAVVLASSLLWGLGGLWIVPGDSFQNHLLMAAVLLALAGAGTGVYLPKPRLAILIVFLLLAPMTAWLFSRQGFSETLLGIGLAGFFLTSIKIIFAFHSRLHHSFLLTQLLNMARSEAENRAGTDELTGVPNRRVFFMGGEQLMEQSRKKHRKLAVIVVDVDHFKRINDAYGHEAGDEVLKKISALLCCSLRGEKGICARIGGEEFALAVPVGEEQEACEIANSLRRKIADTPIDVRLPDGQKRQLAITASFGVSLRGENLKTLTRHADQALYLAKKAGRNRVRSL